MDELAIGLRQFLNDYPGMSIMPSLEPGICLRGKFWFKANVSGGDEIEDSYKLEIIVPDKFPKDIPSVKEIGGKIPAEGIFHVNHDGTLCLGSPLRLLKKTFNATSLTGFASKCLAPYLYAVSHKLKHGGKFVFGELAHGNQGMVDDYFEILGLQDKFQIAAALKLLCVKKRIANKKLCPCKCKKKLGSCPLHFKLNELRKMASLSWFKAHADSYNNQLNYFLVSQQKKTNVCLDRDGRTRQFSSFVDNPNFYLI